MQALETVLQLKPDFVPAQREASKLKSIQSTKSASGSSLLITSPAHHGNMNLAGQDREKEKASSQTSPKSTLKQNAEEKAPPIPFPPSSTLQPILMESKDQAVLNLWLQEYKAISISPTDLLQFKQYIQQSLDPSEMTIALQSMKTMLQTLSTLDDQVKNISEHLDLDESSKAKQTHIDNNPKLKKYQSCLQNELNKFILTYYLATTELQQLAPNKKDTIIDGVAALPTSIPIVGKLLNLFVRAAKAANLSHRYEQINRLVVLFKEPKQIAQVAYRFSVQLTLEKRKIIEEEVKEVSTPIKFLNEFKRFFRHQLQGLKTSNAKGLSLTAEEEQAMEDGASLLAAILSNQAKIDKEKDLVLQFLRIMLGQDYSYPIIENESSKLNVAPTRTSAASPLTVVPVAVVNSSATVLSQLIPGTQGDNQTMAMMMQKLQVQEEQLKRMQEKLEEQEKAKEALATQKKLEDELVILRKKVAQIDRIEEKVHRAAEVDDVLARIKALGLDDLPSVDEVEENGQIRIQMNESATTDPKNHFIKLHKQMFIVDKQMLFFEQHSRAVVEEMLKLKHQVENMQTKPVSNRRK